jgi:branched-chain amino acid transport system permease protein
MSTVSTPTFRTRLNHFKWPIGYVVVIVFLFFLYFAILPSLVRPVSAPVLAWLPVATINECLM